MSYIATFWTNLKSNKLTRAHSYFFLVLTAVLWLLVDLALIPGVMEHPQFTEFIDPDFLHNTLLEKNKLIWYRAFFITDYVWATLLIWGIYKYVKSKFQSGLDELTATEDVKGKSRSGARLKKTLFAIFLFLMIAALGLDWAENAFYLFGYRYMEHLVDAKIITYGIVFVLFILAFLHYTLSRFTTTILRFLGASVYSLIILVILGSFLPKATQVNSIVVNLYQEPFDLLVLYLVAPVFAVVLAHYPSYFKIDENQRNWYMNKISWAMIGTVFYKYRKGSKQTAEGKKEDEVNFLYRILGILFYAALIYMLGYTSEVNFDWNLGVSKLAALSLVAGIVLLYELKRIKDDWFEKTSPYLEQRLPGNYDGDNPLLGRGGAEDKVPKSSQEEAKKVTKPSDDDLLGIRDWVACFVVIFSFTVLFHIVLLIVLVSCEGCQYTEWTAILSLFCIFMQLVSFVFYRTFRSLFRFVFYKDCNAVLNAFYILRDIKLVQDAKKPLSADITLSIANKKKNIYSFFKDHDFSIHNRYFDALTFVGTGSLSNNVTFLQINIFVGIVNAVFFTLINIHSDYALHFNPILIILSGLFLYYGVLVVVTKHLIYYNSSEEKSARTKKPRFNFAVVLTLVLLALSAGLEERFTNNLFTLPLLERDTQEEMTLNSYVSNLPDDEVRYYIGCYGGGMKSNAWTMTVLNDLYRRDNNFFEKTVGISGASGGTIGLINMAAIMKANKEDKEWSDIIEDISTENILSLDLTHILGRDFLNAVFTPFANLHGKDRSTKAMNRYAAMTNNADQICKPTAYRAFWKKLYENQGRHYPILISNSTNVAGNGGMAVSVSVEDTMARALLYQGSDDILDIVTTSYDSLGKPDKRDKKTLGYFDAASTSNRFPLLSPAAKIETKGHYNDGGIYENAGLLSAFKLFRAVNYCENVESLNDLKQCNVFISIVNDKNQYIKHRLAKERKKIEVNRVTEHVEISALLSSIVATEMVPIHVKSELNTLAATYENIEFETIYLPHRFTVDDIKAIYGEELDIGIGVAQTGKELFKTTQKNDSVLRGVLGIEPGYWTEPIIEPPMSRVMAKPAHRFMVAMLEHPDTEEALKAIIRK